MSEPEELLDVLTVSGLLRLPRKSARVWIRRHVPPEATHRDGRQLFVSLSGLNHGLVKCTWRPDLHQPRGFQGNPKRRPPNLSNRDCKGRFISHRADRRPPKQKTPILPPARRRYLSDAD